MDTWKRILEERQGTELGVHVLGVDSFSWIDDYIYEGGGCRVYFLFSQSSTLFVSRVALICTILASVTFVVETYYPNPN